jgi:hypothetical protein
VRRLRGGGRDSEEGEEGRKIMGQEIDDAQGLMGSFGKPDEGMCKKFSMNPSESNQTKHQS